MYEGIIDYTCVYSDSCGWRTGMGIGLNLTQVCETLSVCSR